MVSRLFSGHETKSQNCPGCLGSFVSPSNLKVHLRVTPRPQDNPCPSADVTNWRWLLLMEEGKKRSHIAHSENSLFPTASRRKNSPATFCREPFGRIDPAASRTKTDRRQISGDSYGALRNQHRKPGGLAYQTAWPLATAREVAVLPFSASCFT
jgi:hypothetical protein